MIVACQCRKNGSSADALFGQENQPMLDEIHRLTNNPHLLQLLSYYAALGKEAWHNRLMHLEGVEP